jgi:DNA-binding transcriptional MerR regulator
MHTLDTTLALFNITPMTLRRWCRRARITPHQDPLDLRRRYLDDDQVLMLARLHNRVLIVDSGSIQLSSIEKLEARIAELEKGRQ